MMRVIYETTEDCNNCPHNTGKVCMKLRKCLYDICFERDCPLPLLSDVEQFTRYVTRDKSLKCHGNCRNWERWEYNEHLKTDIGICKASCELLFCHANTSACAEFDEL